MLYWIRQVIGAIAVLSVPCQKLWRRMQPGTVPGLLLTAFGGGMALLIIPSILSMLGWWGHSRLTTVEELALDLISGLGVMGASVVMYMQPSLRVFWQKNGLPRTSLHADWISVIWGGTGVTALVGFMNGALSPLASNLFSGLKPSAVIVTVNWVSAIIFLSTFLYQYIIQVRGAATAQGASDELPTPRSPWARAISSTPMTLIYLEVFLSALLFLVTLFFLVTGGANSVSDSLLRSWATVISLAVTAITSAMTGIQVTVAAKVQQLQPKGQSIRAWMRCLPSIHQWLIGLSIIGTAVSATVVIQRGLPAAFNLLTSLHLTDQASRPYQLVLMQWVFVLSGITQQGFILLMGRWITPWLKR